MSQDAPFGGAAVSGIGNVLHNFAETLKHRGHLLWAHCKLQ